MTHSIYSKIEKVYFTKLCPKLCVSEVVGSNLNHYFNRHVCPSIRLSRSSRSSQNFFSLKSPWNHSLTPGIDLLV